MVLCNVLLLLQCGSKEENIHYIVGFFVYQCQDYFFYCICKCLYSCDRLISADNNVLA